MSCKTDFVIGGIVLTVCECSQQNPVQGELDRIMGEFYTDVVPGVPGKLSGQCRLDMHSAIIIRFLHADCI